MHAIIEKFVQGTYIKVMLMPKYLIRQMILHLKKEREPHV